MTIDYRLSTCGSVISDWNGASSLSLIDSCDCADSIAGVCRWLELPDSGSTCSSVVGSLQVNKDSMNGQSGSNKVRQRCQLQNGQIS